MALGQLPGHAVPGLQPSPGSITNFYSANNGTNVGAQFAGAPHAGQELLMQTALATGRDATDICPGGYMQHVFDGLKLNPAGQTAVIRTRTRTAHIKVLCPGQTYGSCKGVLSVDATFGNSNTLIGSGTFNISHGFPAGVDIKLSPAALKLAQKARVLSTNVNIQAHDDPGSDSRAKPGIAMQSKVTTGNIRLKPDRLTTATHKKKRKKKHH